MMDGMRYADDAVDIVGGGHMQAFAAPFPFQFSNHQKTFKKTIKHKI